MDVYSKAFFRRILFLGIFFLKGASSQEFSIVHIDPAHLSPILEDEQVLRDLTRALSEARPVFLQTAPEKEFYHLHHPGPPPKKKETRHPSRNTHPDFPKNTVFTLPDPKPSSSSLFPPRRELGPKFSTPKLTYGFVPRVQKTERGSPKLENKSFRKSQARNLPARRQNLKLQKTERGSRRNQSAKNQQISALRYRQSQFPSKETYYRSNWDDNHWFNADSKHVEAGVKTHHNTERGQESVRRPTTLIGNSHISFVHHPKEYSHYKQELPSRHNKNANKKFGNEGTTERPRSFVNFALNVNLPDTPAYKVNGANDSLSDAPVTLYRNPEHGDIETKRYLVFKTTTLVTTKRPSSAPFTATSFFRNLPQAYPREVTVPPPKYSPQVTAVLPIKPSSTLATKPTPAEDKTATTPSYSSKYSNDFQVTNLKTLSPYVEHLDKDEYHKDFQVTNLKKGQTPSPYVEHIDKDEYHKDFAGTTLKEGKTLSPYVGHQLEDLYYEEDPFGDVTEVHSHDSFELPSEKGLQAQRNSSLHPISSPSSSPYAVHQESGGKSEWEKPEAKKSSSKKSFAKTKSKNAEDADGDDNSGVPGKPGTDYPNYYEIPQTNFDCNVPGFYADVQAGCQVFHNCDTDLQKHSFLCPNGTVFRQELRICDWWYNARCEDSYPLQP